MKLMNGNNKTISTNKPLKLHPTNETQSILYLKLSPQKKSKEPLSSSTKDSPTSWLNNFKTLPKTHKAIKTIKVNNHQMSSRKTVVKTKEIQKSQQSCQIKAVKDQKPTKNAINNLLQETPTQFTAKRQMKQWIIHPKSRWFNTVSQEKDQEETANLPSLQE